MTKPARRTRSILGLAAVAFALAFAPACADQGEPSAKDAARSRPSASGSAQRKPVDAELVAFLSKARAAHHSADIAESADDLKLAIKHVEAVPYGPLPPQSPEVREVVADAHARLADLKSRVGMFDEAAREIERGLVHAVETTHFRGHLFEVRGLVEERRMKDLEAKGDAAGAEKARKAALDAFETAIKIQDEVITKLLPDPAPSGGPPPATSP